MAVTMKGFPAIMETLHRDLLNDLQGRGYVDGLSFKVFLGGGLNRMLYGGGVSQRVYDRPFTYREHRRHVWATRRKRWRWRIVGPWVETKHRLGRAWDALRGRDDDGWY